MKSGDLLHSNKPFTDADIVNEVLNNWYESKKRISRERWLTAIQWMRNNDFAPDVIFTAEDGVPNGGFGSNIAVLLQKNEINTRFEMISVPETPIDHGSIEELYSEIGLDSVGIMKTILRKL